MHKDFAQEYFELQLHEMEADARYNIQRTGDFEVLVSVQAGRYLPVFRIKADYFDLEPPLIEFADPNTGMKLDNSRWPSGQSIASGNNLLPGNIICVTGNRAYHTHPGHIGETFHAFRNNFTFKGFLDRLADNIAAGRTNMDATGGIYNV